MERDRLAVTWLSFATVAGMWVILAVLARWAIEDRDWLAMLLVALAALMVASVTVRVWVAP